MPASSAGETARDSIVDRLFARASELHREAVRLARDGSAVSVDREYEAAVLAYGALNYSLADSGTFARKILDLHNEALSDCLHAAVLHGRIDSRSHLFIDTPSGTMEVPIVHHGFVWGTDDFRGLFPASAAPFNPSLHRPHCRDGIGAAEVVERPNPRINTSDQFLPSRAYFPATAILRPNLAVWLGTPAQTGDVPRGDVLEFYDPIRTRSVDIAGRRVSLTADLDAPFAFAHEAEASRKAIREGFRDPDKQLHRVNIDLLEPHQPGKTILLLVHGLRDDPFHFTDLVGALRMRPGFADRYQIATFRYPTGDTFLRSAAQLRQYLHRLSEAFDPEAKDPGVQNMVMVGFSMGGLLAKLQIASGGDILWAKASPLPLDSLVTSDSARAMLREFFYFEPVPQIRRVIYIATPHDGASIPTQILGRTYTRFLGQPSDTHAIAEQLKRDNPGAVHRFLAEMPSSLDLMSHERPFLAAMRKITVNPATIQHTIAGTAYMPAPLARGDGVMSLVSAHVPEAASETWVNAIHTNICTNLDVIAEIDRILHVHQRESMTSVTP